MFLSVKSKRFSNMSRDCLLRVSVRFAVAAVADVGTALAKQRALRS